MFSEVTPNGNDLRLRPSVVLGGHSEDDDLRLESVVLGGHRCNRHQGRMSTRSPRELAGYAAVGRTAPVLRARWGTKRPTWGTRRRSGGDDDLPAGVAVSEVADRL